MKRKLNMNLSLNSDEESTPENPGSEYNSDGDSDATVENLTLKYVQKEKKSRFADEVSRELETVLLLDDSDLEYRRARKGHWIILAFVRRLFKLRIEKLSKIISPILTKEHRDWVYQKYFAD